jgi:hypothetical protein
VAQLVQVFVVRALLLAVAFGRDDNLHSPLLHAFDNFACPVRRCKPSGNVPTPPCRANGRISGGCSSIRRIREEGPARVFPSGKPGKRR